MATMLSIINDALAMLGDEALAASELTGLTQERARVMAEAWPQAVDEMLSDAPWIFASRVVQLSPLGSTTEEQNSFAAPGYSYAFEVPDDHLRTNWLRDTSSTNSLPIHHLYQDGYWHADVSTIYVSYVSHDYRAPETWTPLFASMVSGYLAYKRGSRIRPAADMDAMRKTFEGMQDRAKAVDANERPFAWPASGRLVRSRLGRYDRYGDYRS